MGRGRPPKKGVDWFPHDTSASDSGTLHMIEVEFGNDGYAFWFKVLELLGKTEEFYIDCKKKKDWLLLVDRSRVSEEKANQILDSLAEMEAIDTELWEKHRVIWSDNFVDRLSELLRKRDEKRYPKRPCFDASGIIEKPEQNPGKVSQESVSVSDSEGKADQEKISDPLALGPDDFERQKNVDDLEMVWRSAGGHGFTMQDAADCAELLGQYSADEIHTAIVKAGRQHKVHMAYVTAILKNGGGKKDDGGRGGGDRAAQGRGRYGGAQEQGTKFDPRYEGEVF